MAGRGPAPKTNRRPRSKKPTRGEWKPAPGSGWQHGPVPRPPDGLLKASRDLWAAWFGSWFAAHWKPEDIGSIRLLIQLYDQCQRGHFERSTEFRLGCDTWGISPKGQQDRRWSQPVEEAPAMPSKRPPGERPEPYKGLKVVG